MARAETPFTQQPLPPSEPVMTAREGVRILIHELQGRTINLCQVLESGIEPIHGHCRGFLGLAKGDSGFMYEPDEYTDYFRDKLGIEGWIQVNSRFNRRTLQVSVLRSNHWPVDSVVRVFPWVDFSYNFEQPLNPYNIVGPSINTTRVGKRGNLYSIDIPLGENIPRSEEVLLRRYGSGIDKCFVTEEGQKLLTAFLAARV